MGSTLPVLARPLRISVLLICAAVLLWGAACDGPPSPPLGLLPGATPEPTDLPPAVRTSLVEAGLLAPATATPPPTRTPYVIPTPILDRPAGAAVRRERSTELDGACWTEFRLGAGKSAVGISDLAAVPGGDLWAVGSAGMAGEPSWSLAVRGRGDEWEVVPSPNIGTHGSRLTAVSGVAGGDVWAAGSWSQEFDPDLIRQRLPLGMLLAHWDGTSWRVVFSSETGIPEDIVALPSGDVWVAGWQGDTSPGAQETGMLRRWNGSGWDSPGRSAGNPWPYPMMTSMSALAPDDIWIAGLGFMLHWDGARLEQTKLPIAGDPTVKAVEAVSRDDVWALADFHNADRGGREEVILHWDGRAWSSVAMPNLGAYDGLPTFELQALGARSSSEVLVGGVVFAEGGEQQILLRRQGSGFQLVRLPGDWAVVRFIAITWVEDAVWIAGTRQYYRSAGEPVEVVLLRIAPGACAP